MKVKYNPNINNYYNSESNRENNLFKHYQKPEYKLNKDFNHLPDFPFVSSLEFTNHCNLDCLFCARAVMTRPLGFMEEEIFYKVLDEYRAHGTFVKVNGYGENLLHPKSLEFIAEIKKKNGLYFTSNFTKVNKKVAHCFVDNNVDVVQISFQGVDKTSYEAQRRKSNFDLLIKNIKTLVEVRGENPYPLIHLSTTILDETDNQLSDFINLGFELGVDSVGIGRTDYDRVIDEMIVDQKRRADIEEMKKRQSLTKVPDHSYLYRYIDINWDGIVVSSFFDFNEFIPVGDLHKNTLHEIWNNSPVLNALRTLNEHGLLNKMKVFDTFYHAWNVAPESSYNLNLS